MIAWLARLFLGREQDFRDARVRQVYGMLCGAMGIALNLLLFAGKLLASAWTGSVAMAADAFNNLSDAGSSVVTLVGFKLSRQKPDTEHPFGHGRIEYIAGLVVAMAIVLMGVELLKTSVEKIASPEEIVFHPVSLVILLAAVAVKMYMAFYNRSVGQKIDSAAMRATAADSLSDTAATGAVLVATLISHFAGINLDGWCGLLVALFILWTGLRAFKETVDPLLGQPPRKEVIDHIGRLVRSHPEIIGMHDLIVHDYGPGRMMISLHAEVPASGDVLALHDVIDNAERELRDSLGCTAVIHMDPVVTDDALTDCTRERVAEAVKALDERVSIHDFRMVSGPTHTNLIFDVAVPYDVNLSENEIRQRIAHLVRALDERYFAVVEIDRVYIEA